MSKLVLVLMPVLLSGLILGRSVTSAAVTYYVSPTNQSCPKNVSKRCYSLDDYVANSSKFFSSEEAVTLIFVNETHTSSCGKFKVTGLTNLTMIGEFQNATIESVEVNITDVETLRILSLVFKGSTNVSVQPSSYDRGKYTVGMHDCKFEGNSSLKIIRSNLSLDSCEFFHVNPSPTSNPLTVYDSHAHLDGTNFIGSKQTALLAFYSDILFKNTVEFINNTGIGGGAMALFSTRLHFGNTANVSFINNTALTIGGAIYVELGEIVRLDSDSGVFLCFYQVLPPLESSAFQVLFRNNSAGFGGDNIYGTYLNSTCHVSNNSSFTLDLYKHFHFETSSISSVSSTPDRVCVCDSNGRPQCANLSMIFMTRTAYPGETITIPTAIVGGDFGTTVGTVYIGFLGHDRQSSRKVSHYRNCTNISYTLKPRNDNSSYNVMHLSTEPYDDDRFFQPYKADVESAIEKYNNDTYMYIPYALITTPVYINITLLECPPGFSLQVSVKNSTKSCDCHHELRNHIECNIDNNNVLFSWSSNAWIGVNTSTNINGVSYGASCPFDYCRDGEKNISYMGKSDDQCESNRAGRLCGGCRDGFSLAIGSSRCIPCSNNSYLALLIFFVAAGFLLVLFISIVNLTVSQGMINGVIFYANIIWAYQSIVLTQKYDTDAIKNSYGFIQIFLAWINLDFGIETCFIRGLNGFWKTWLQFVFPFYTAGLFILGVQFSSKLSKLFGDRSVPTLATLLFLSYTKLLRTIIAALGLARVKIFSNDLSITTLTVWSVDGNYIYGVHPHIYLVLAAIACLLLLWLPYTLLLLLMQWLRKVPYSKPSQLITRYKPIFDTYYAPLKDKHHYWFGVLLLVQGTLLFISSLTSNIYPNINLFLLLTFSALLLFYMSFMQVYRRKVVIIVESSFLLNLILLVGGFILFNDSKRGQMIVLYVSISIAILEFCGIVVWSLIKTYFLKFIKRGKNNDRPLLSQPNTSYTTPKEEQAIQRESDRSTPVSAAYIQFRDSILEDPLTLSTEESSLHTRSS